ncbi:MAG: adenine nucleotide alpha hydrolase [Melioribacteraceae bacterium]|nr:MAG: adenine nucleotide alpha hydrolase [Melioribacteraceae bacterium]
MERLERYIAGFDKVAIAFSAGVDSTLLAFAANKVLGKNALIYTIKTPYMPEWEIKSAVEIGEKYDFNLKFIELETPESINNNPDNRCYLCKSVLFKEIIQKANMENVDVIFDGSNVDDTKEIRPGMRALRELGIRSPFIELSFNKHEIRRLSRETGLPTWDTPSNACLLTRLPYDFQVNPELLKKVETAENILRKNGYNDVRVRHHEEIARIELPTSKIAVFINDENREVIIENIKALGYKFVTLDLEGYKTGSMGDGENR